MCSFSPTFCSYRTKFAYSLHHHIHQSLPTPSSTMKRPRSESQTLTPSTPHIIDTKPTKPITRNPKNLLTQFSNPQTLKWAPLNLNKSELFLPLTFPTGQTFRWKRTHDLEYTGVVASHLVSLKQEVENGEVFYCCHTTTTTTTSAEARLELLDFLNVGICLSDLWDSFSASDWRFSELAKQLCGARVLRQDPLECLIQFICSSNNNIGRITGMVDYVSSLGDYLGSFGGFEFHQFPSLDQLSLVSEEDFRRAGFGYRAKYIVGTVKSLQSKPGGGTNWLASLRKLDLPEVIDALRTLPGVGPKVAACIALFSLDQHHAIPVDTHVWQIATRYLLPELAGARLTPKLCVRVADTFVSKYGKYAGWAQTLLFIADLPSQKAQLDSSFWISENKKSEISAEEKDSEVVIL